VIRVTRRYRFSASHRLHAPALDASENRRIYGKCNNPFGHGHNYELEVSAGGPVDETGRALDVRRLDALVGEHVLAPFAHRNLNAECPEFQAVVPTSENLGVEIVRRLKRNWRAAFPGEWPRLEKICIAETGHNIFEISANEIE
jgi:6-pyruvoyltetrahydropterin/6-carboxytetrahydropterin synthase